MIRFLFTVWFDWSRGYRLRPWRSPYLRWRVETFWGLHAERITAGEFIRFAWRQRRDLIRFFKWAAQMPRARNARVQIETRQDVRADWI